MSNKVIIDEKILDNLLLKALPQEYEVLLEGYGLDEDEEEYLILILLLLNGHIEVITDWLKSDDGRKILNGAEELGLNFFDKLEYEIRLKLHDSFTNTIIPLLLSWYTYGNQLAYNELNLLPSFLDSDWLIFDSLKQYNYNLLTDLSKDVCVTLRDVLYDGIKKGLDIDELTQLLLNNGLRGKGKFDAKTRAEMIARTEKTRLLNQAKLNTFKENGVEWIDFITRKDARVCSYCLEIEADNPHRLDQIEESDKMPPVHPRCRCIIMSARPPQDTI